MKLSPSWPMMKPGGKNTQAAKPHKNFQLHCVLTAQVQRILCNISKMGPPCPGQGSTRI
jgi:hypothetical protein